MKKCMLIPCIALLTGCLSDFHQVNENEKGYLPAATSAPVEVTVNHSLDTRHYKSLAYVNIQMHGVSDWPAYEDYVMQGIKHFGFFDQVITRQPTVFINTDAFAPTQIIDKKEWLDVDNRILWNSLLKEYGTHFLVFEADLYSVSTDPDDLQTYAFDLKIVEPQTRRVLVSITNHMASKSGIDKDVINPVLDYALGYLNFYDSTYPRGVREPPTWYEWWEEINDDFINAMFV